VRCSCLNQWLTQSKLKSSLKNKNQELDLRERERERAQACNLKEAFCFFEWPATLGGRWGSIYRPHLKRAVGVIFHRISLVDLSGSR
jgi:hypothetical protein